MLLGRAADWFLAQGQVEEAVEHRVAAGDVAGALALLRGHTRWFLDRGAMGTMLRLSADLPGAELDPHLCLDLALAAGLSGQPGRSGEWLAAAEPHIEADPDPVPGWRTLRAYADFIWAVYGTTGDVEAAPVPRPPRRRARDRPDPVGPLRRLDLPRRGTARGRPYR